MLTQEVTSSNSNVILCLKKIQFKAQKFQLTSKNMRLIAVAMIFYLIFSDLLKFQVALKKHSLLLQKPFIFKLKLFDVEYDVFVSFINLPLRKFIFYPSHDELTHTYTHTHTRHAGILTHSHTRTPNKNYSDQKLNITLFTGFYYVV